MTHWNESPLQQAEQTMLCISLRDGGWGELRRKNKGSKVTFRQSCAGTVPSPDLRITSMGPGEGREVVRCGTHRQVANTKPPLLGSGRDRGGGRKAILLTQHLSRHWVGGAREEACHVLELCLLAGGEGGRRRVILSQGPTKEGGREEKGGREGIIRSPWPVPQRAPSVHLACFMGLVLAWLSTSSRKVCLSDWVLCCTGLTAGRVATWLFLALSTRSATA